MGPALEYKLFINEGILLVLMHINI